MMFSVKHYVIAVLSLCTASEAVHNLKVHFPLSNDTSFPRFVLGTLPELEEFTFCASVRPLRLNVEYPYIFSYATARSSNELTVLLQNVDDSILGYVELGESFATFSCPNVDWKVGSWVHVCASWLGTDGTTKFYGDGQLCNSVGPSEISANGNIQGGGVAIIGQDQDSLGSTFDPHQAWYGDMSHIYLWSEVLTDKQIQEAAKCKNKRKEGTVIAWSKTAMAGFDGVVISETQLCEE